MNHEPDLTTIASGVAAERQLVYQSARNTDPSYIKQSITEITTLNKPSPVYHMASEAKQFEKEHFDENIPQQLKSLRETLSKAAAPLIGGKDKPQGNDQDCFKTLLIKLLKNPPKTFDDIAEFEENLPSGISEEDRKLLVNTISCMVLTYSYGKNLAEKVGIYRQNHHPFIGVAKDYEKQRLEVIQDCLEMANRPPPDHILARLVKIERAKNAKPGITAPRPNPLINQGRTIKIVGLSLPPLN